MKWAITAEEQFLAIPVYTADIRREDLHKLHISAGDQLIYEFDVPKSREGEPDYYAYLPIGAYAGERLCIEADLEEGYFSRIHQSHRELLPEEERAKLHYTAPYGWINDPNGMVYHEGVYHLYYQHNPMNTEWANMSWGHCISRDLLHFTYVSDVMFPDARGTIYSGCGLINERGCFGLPKEALLFFYTAAGSCNAWSEGVDFTQRMAYSLDGGKSLMKYENFSLPCIEGGNRDPKIFWHEESQAYIMVLYLAENRFVILRSTNLEQWKESDRFSYPPMWECPDLFLLSSEEGEKKWALMSADGFYYIGSFDGYRFQRESEMMNLYKNTLPYAAQSFSHTGDRVISIAWLRSADKGKKYSGMMSIAREFTLGKDAGGYYIHQSFVREARDYVLRENGSCVIEDEGIIERISADGRMYEVILS